MNKILLLLTMGVFSVSMLCAQITTDEYLVSNNSFRVNIVGAEYNYEHYGRGKFAMNYTIGVGSNISTLDDEINYHVVPYLTFEPRYYYNFDKRVSLGKNTRVNSANYIALKSRIISPSIVTSTDDSGAELQFAPVWGIKRVYRSKLMIDVYLGYAIRVSDIAVGVSADTEIGPSFGSKAVAGINFGYIFNKINY